MKIVRVHYQYKTFYAALEEGLLRCLTPQIGVTERFRLEEAQLLPLVNPSKVVCVGLNYKGHAAELGMPLPEEPMFFLKPPSSIINTGQPIYIPPQSTRVDYEAELAIIIGRETRFLSTHAVPDHIFGYTCANDVTARDLQKSDGMFGRCKGFDTFLPIGPWLETNIQDPSDLSVKLYKNDQLVQQGHTSDMLFSPLELVANISHVMTLLPGDVVLTGTPHGIGPIQDGDEIQVEIDGIGTLINPVKNFTKREGSTGLPVQ
ncbi:fumarylacetoacetate hydrolase family protein [Halodesulfovibrio sp.]|jgi:2-keto-4-pentenoate hydratase/2-oxohepta-3-ene-1,7-dioic acid hydratase in catechol pathway|uniref:fumarylacetoacetate hydrolase family protein n=1 Tax=Halodesulfovibrio sp. TaxID=1912772 RepID=UPI0025F9B846|nr:fumarylacetoacetate hydrolase family protein [Halodesulfovibrio sp.]MCT4535487.1 fumarylacetoacetate hydrolase family protein [Halodesulfovibrio sp.]MCT4626300.1 fumarylacetoacetate hydrolase family protein [Halodesulfovibrio sp.]